MESITRNIPEPVHTGNQTLDAMLQPEMKYETEIDYDYLKTIEGDDNALFDYIAANFMHPDCLNESIVRRKKIDRHKIEETIVPGSAVSGKQRCVIMSRICSLLGLKPTPDQMIFIMAEYPALLCEAGAGAGKTTMSQSRAIKCKLINGYTGMQILALTYSRAAMLDMKDRHTALVNKLNMKYGDVFQMDPYLECYTFHSFALSWITEYPSRFGLKSSNPEEFLLQEDGMRIKMGHALDMWLEDNESVSSKINAKVRGILISNLCTVYNLATETLDPEFEKMYKNESLTKILSYIPTKDAIHKILEYYAAKKQRAHQLDYSDILNKFYELLCDKEVLDRIRSLYKYMIVDEYQDITPNMLRSIAIIINGDPNQGLPVSDIKLTAIGDSDQSIYEFRGTDIKNYLRFKEQYGTERSKIVSMSENRRCLAPIIEAAGGVITANKNRFYKPLVAMRGVSLLEEDAGKDSATAKYRAVEVRGYNSEMEYVQTIVDELRDISKTRESVAIIYRNRASSALIAMELFKAGIPFDVGSGIKPYEDELSKTIWDIFEMLSSPMNFRVIESALPKVLSKHRAVTKSVIERICKSELDIYNSNKDNMMKPFWEYDFSSIRDNGKLRETLNDLKVLSQEVKARAPMDQVLSRIVGYLDFFRLRLNSSMPPESCEGMILNNFKVSKSYYDFKQEHSARMEKFKDSTALWNNVLLTTFHSTKGLEFDRVYIIDMSDDVFPGRELLNVTNEEFLENTLEGCRRLLYVAMTRAKNKLVMYVNKNNPSRFVETIDRKFFMDDLDFDSKTVSAIEHTTYTISQVVDPLTMEISAGGDGYFESLPVISVKFGEEEYCGATDLGFIHVGDYVALEAAKHARLDVESKFDMLLNEFEAESEVENDISNGLFGDSEDQDIENFGDLFGTDESGTKESSVDESSTESSLDTDLFGSMDDENTSNLFGDLYSDSTEETVPTMNPNTTPIHESLTRDYSTPTGKFLKTFM